MNPVAKMIAKLVYNNNSYCCCCCYSYLDPRGSVSSPGWRVQVLLRLGCSLLINARVHIDQVMPRADAHGHRQAIPEDTPK